MHGVCHGAWCWAHYLPWFAQRGFDAHALSLRGHAGSAGRDQLDSFTLDDYVADLLDVVRSLARAPVVVGHSMGGAIVQRYLAREERTIVGAVLLASAVPGGLGTGWMVRNAVRMFLRSRPGAMKAARAITEGKPVTSAQMAAIPFFSNRLSNGDVERWGSLLQPESRTAVKDLRAPYADRHDVAVPLMVLGSTADMIFGRRDVLRTAATYGVPAVLFDDLCHDMQLDPAWEQPAQAILAFLERMFG